VKHGLARLGLEIRRVESVLQLDGVGNMPGFLQHLRARGLGVAHALDVGANRGDWARLARSVFGCRVTMLEPLEEMGGYLRGMEGCEWVQAGAGAERGELDLAVFENLVGSSFNGPDDIPRRSVPVLPLAELPPADLVKVDVQGFEMEVLRGAGHHLGGAEVWIVETSLHRFHGGGALAEEVIGCMAEHGYGLYDVAGFLRRPSDGALAQVDACFARRGGLLDTSNW
jgi:FkbM family methyltransferase